MPQRSNDFQRLITRIYEQLVSTAALVRQSAMVRDKETGEEREIDILIEIPAPGMGVTRIGIECRDRTRASDVTWIDELVGKYAGLPVHRIIAVSRKPFTKQASRKANRHNIEVRTLADALAADWPADLFDIGFTHVTHWALIRRIHIVSDPPWPDGVEAAAIYLDDFRVERLGFAAWQRKRFAEIFNNEAGRQRRAGISTFSNSGIHNFAVDLVPPPYVLLVAHTGAVHRVRCIRLIGVIEVDNAVLENERFTLNDVGVTRVRAVLHGSEIDALAVQEPGQRVSVRVTTNRRNPEAATKSRVNFHAKRDTSL